MGEIDMNIEIGEIKGGGGGEGREGYKGLEIEGSGGS